MIITIKIYRFAILSLIHRDVSERDFRFMNYGIKKEVGVENE